MTPTLKSRDKEPTEPVSDEFEAAFSDRSSGCMMDCNCGRTCFDVHNQWDWHTGELERLKVAAEKQPLLYQPLAHGCTGFTIDGRTFVMGCPCNGARKYEDWIIRHERQLAHYLNFRSSLLIGQGEAIKVAGILAGEDLVA
jgi:hypothetical protein